MNGVPMRRGAAPWPAWLAFLLVVAVLLAAAGPAAAQTYTTGTVVSPPFLGKSNLNNAVVRVRSSGSGAFIRRFTGGARTVSFWSVSGAPSGANISISNVSTTIGTRTADVTLAYTGDFTEDFTLTLQGDFSVYSTGDDPERYTIPVLANGTRRLVVGSVMGQATEAGGQSTFAVALGTPISAAVSVSVSSQDGTEGTVSPSDLTFSTSNWATAQTVTVTGANDDVDDGDVTWQVRLDPASEGSGGDSGYHALANVDVDVTTTDDDTFGITVTPATSTSNRLRTSEDGSTATFTVVLDSEPTGNVVLDVASSDTAQGTVDTDSVMNGLQSALTFTTSNWNTAQTVTLTGVDDSPGTADGSQTYDVTLTVNQTSTADANYDTHSAITVYAVNADDEYGLSVGSVTGQATEAGGQSTFTVALATQPTAAVTVSVSSLDTGEGRASPSSMTFTTSNWNVNQTVTVTGEDDTVHDGTVTWQVRLDPASGGSGGDSDYHGLANVDVDVTTTDDDTLTAALSLSAASIAESGSSNTSAVSAVLSRPSSAATTLTVTAVSGAFTVPSGASGRIEIAAGDTTTTSTVTITAVDNDTDAPNRTETVTATAVNDTGSGVASVTGATLTITDDDDPPDVTLSLSAASIAENGGTSVVSAVLSRPSSAATTVTVTGVSGAFTVPSSAAAQRIVFAAGDTTSTDTVTVTAVDNTTDEPNRTPTVSATMANDQGTGSVTGVTLTLTDNDDAPTVTLSASPASISENEATSAISAALSNPSSAVTTVTVTAAMGAAYTVPSNAAAQRIVFAAGATTSADTVTVTSVDNDVDALTSNDNNMVTVTGTAANTQGVGTVTGAALTITDDDVAAIVLSPSTSTSSRLRTTEAGGQAEFTVALATQPTASVVLDVQSSDTDQGTVSASSLTFTTSNWGTAQTVTLTGVDDNPGTTDGSQTYTVSVRSNIGMTQDAKYNGLAGLTVYAINADDELGLDVGAVTGQATEAGGTSTFTVALLTQPTAAVTVAVSSRDASEGRVSPSSMTFSTSNWNVDQTVTVTGANDDVDDGDVGWAVRLDSSSGDTDYNALANVDVAVTTTDDDTAALTVSPTPSTTSRLRTTEAGGQATFTVQLATEPTGDVVLDAASALTTEGTVSPAMLTFTASSWATAQTVTLTGANDDVDDGDRNYDVTLTVNQTNTADTVYDALPAVTVYAANADDDEAGVTVSPETSTTQRLRTSEDESTATFTVVLDTEPAGNVVLDVASTDTAQGTVSPADLTFTASNWNTAQTVTLTGVDDDHPVNNPGGSPDGSQNYTVTLTVDQTNTLDSNYDGLSAVTVYARNLDDEAGVEVSIAAGTTLTTTEAGGAATFTVVLLSAPEGADVTIPVTSSEPSEGAVSPGRLVFTPDNATTAQTVTVTGVDDPTDDGDVAYTIVTGDPSSADPTYDGLGAGDVDDVSVVNEDDDGPPTATLAVDPSSISENGGETRVTATLSHPSVAATTVTVAAVEGVYEVGSDAAIVIAAGDTTAAADDTVTVTAVNNAVDAADNEVAVAGAAVNDRAAADSQTVAVTGASLTITDDDEKGLALALAGSPEDPVEGIDVPEGEPVAYTVALTSMPTATVSVAVAAGNTSLTVSTVGLTFTPDGWSTPQTVMVTANAGADDSANEASWVSHTASGGGYDEEFRLPVSVRGETAVRIKETPGTTIYAVEGRLVEVEVVGDIPAGVELDFAGVGRQVAADETLKVTLSTEVSDSVVARAADDGFNLGAAASRVVVDIDVGALSGGRQVCLPVIPVDAVEGAADRVQLLRYDESRGAWEAVTEGREYDAAAGEVCATVAAFSPFATGYADTTPTFADGVAIPDFDWVVDEPIDPPVTLPAVQEGTGDGEIRYTLTPGPETLPPGVSFDSATRVLSGTPTEEFAPKDYIWTATDDDGNTDTLTFTIEVEPARAKARARLKRINESILPELSRASWDSAMAAVSGRLESAAGGGGGPGAELSSALAGFARSNEQAGEDDPSWKEMLSGQSFAVALGGGGEGGAAGPGGSGRSLTIWGAGDRRRLSRDEPSLKWSGDLYAAHLGADVALGSGFMSGLGMSWFESALEYEDRSEENGEGKPVEGVHSSRMASVQPYVGWSSARGSRLWASVGYGMGEIEIVDQALVERYGRQRSDSELVAAAAGGALRVASSGAIRVDVKGEGHVTRYAVRDNGEGPEDLIEGLSVGTRRLRMTAQGSREFVLSGGGRVTPLAELGVRWDGGDGATGAGMEVGAGVAWVGPGGGLQMDVNGRWLVAHRGEVAEWGVSGGLSFASGRNGRGLSLSVEPGWGEAQSGVSRLWDAGVSGRASSSGGRAGAALEAEMGYGTPAFGGSGVATPYTRYGQGRDERRYGLGWRLSGGSAEGFELDVGAWRRERGAARAEHGAGLDLRLRW